jgi:hypothetical protein
MEEEETDILFATRDKDGGVTLYIDEDWAAERGVDPAKLITVEIPQNLYAEGSVQDVRAFVANYLEAREASEN